MRRLIAVFFTFLFFSQHGLTQSDFIKVGHRGCAGLMPENTIAGMIKAIELGATVLEMDVLITKDLKVVVSHDPFFSSKYTIKPNGAPLEEWEENDHILFKMNYDSIKKYDVGLKYNPQLPSQKKMRAVKPLLVDLIDSVENYCLEKRLPKVEYMIEIKDLFTPGLHHPTTSSFVDLVVKAINDKKISSRVIMASFSVPAMRYLQNRFPNFQTCLYSGTLGNFQEVLNALGFYPTYYSPNFSLATDALVASCNYNRVKVIPWTVNYKSKIDSLVNIGVDGIISDFPNHIDLSKVPVVFGYKKSVCKNNNMEFSWQTQSETNVSYFQIEKSLKGIHWEKAVTISGKGGRLTTVNYTWKDENFKGQYPFYRLALVPSNGGVRRYFSFEPVSHCFDNNFYLALFPNPATNVLKGRIISDFKSNVTFYIYNFNGQLVKNTHVELFAGVNNFNIANLNGWAKGEYKVIMDKTGSDLKTYTVFKL